ncbi:MAG: PQQ-binding-like beta-propeller repeat protein [Planctomycetota bacterium]|nr:PQQ-binding-like beta-propeller repeat protein [Planctomycetota bacterium]
MAGRVGWTGTALAAALAAAIPCAQAADQPQWGARHSRNMVSEETGLADSFDPAGGANVRWAVPLGTHTNSTPVVAGGRVYVGTNNGSPRDPRLPGDRGVLMCFDEATGKLLWQLVVPKLTEITNADWYDIGITSPPTVEGDRVYLVTNRCEVVCLDADGMADGNDGPFTDEGSHLAGAGNPPLQPAAQDADIVWLFDMVAEAGVRPHNASNSSPLLVGDRLYVGTSNGVEHTHKRVPAPDAPSLVVLDKRTGRLVAKDAAGIGRRLFHGQWSSPSLGEAGGKALIFFGGGDGFLYAFEALPEPPAETPATLRQVWAFDGDPAGRVEDPHAFFDNRREGPSVFIGMPVFSEGRVYVAASGDTWHGKRASALKCVEANGTGDVTRSAQVWSYATQGHCLSTPAVGDGLVYIADTSGRVHCLDAATGQAVWVHEAKGEIYGSPLLADGKVHVGTTRREFWILAAGREKRVVSRVTLGSAMHASPVAANGVLYVATDTMLYAVGKSRNALREPQGPEHGRRAE